MTSLRLLAVAAVGVISVLLQADDATAVQVYQQGREAYGAGDYRTAASHFEEAEIEADSPVIKANSLRAQIAAYQMCEMPYSEFERIERLLNDFPEFADFGTLVRREFELGDAYYLGQREPAYWSLRWIPWLVGGDKSIEIYNKALKRAPFAAEAPGVRLRLAYLYSCDGKVRESNEELRVIIRDFPRSPECKYAYLALGTGLFELAKRGDGDSRYNREAYDVFQEFLKRYPDASETEWVRTHLAQLRDIQAQRLYDIAKFYEDSGRKQASERYLAQVLKEYPDTEAAAESERKLVELDKSFVPDDFWPDPEARIPAYSAYPLPKEAEKLLILPSAENRKFLLPVYELELNRAPEQEVKK